MSDEQKSPLKEITQPFVDLMHAPRAFWGINLSYMIEGMVYFGVLGYLAIYFGEFVFQGVEHADEIAHKNVMVLTAGITIAMVFLGFLADKWGFRRAIIIAFIFMLAGRILISAAPTVLGMKPAGQWSPLHLTTLGGIVLVVIGYGMYQPAAYAGVRKFTTPKTAAMGFAMLYALMNLGGWFPSFAFLLRDEDFLNFGIPGTYWVYAGFTALALILTVFILTKKTVADAIAKAKSETAEIEAVEGTSTNGKEVLNRESEQVNNAEIKRNVPFHLWFLVVVFGVMICWDIPQPSNYIVGAILLLVWISVNLVGATRRWLAVHPLSNGKFCFFIFALIPVQTLFTYNWLILPPYISRAFQGWIGDYFEVFSNANPLLIFILVPIITALSQKAKVYNMMILGTFIMAAPAFFLVIGPNPYALAAYIVIMTVGEAMWQPRFLQYAAQIAPEGQTGQYVGVAQLPWFLTKVLVPWLYSGWMMDRYCPAEGTQDTSTMWLIFACIAMSSTVLLVVAKRWVGKDFKTHAD